jgi:hypothetical protein
MDIRNYTWVDTFVVNATNSSLPQTSRAPISDVNDIVIGVLSGIIGIIFSGIVGFLVYQWQLKRKQKEVLNIPK